MSEEFSVPLFHYSSAVDIYDGKPWTEMDIEDLRAAAEHGSTLKEAARATCAGPARPPTSRGRPLSLG